MSGAMDVVCVASWNVDLIAHIAQPLARGQTQMAQHFERLPGGKGSNAAIAAARQGAQVGLISRIGGDDFGQMGLDLWAREGISSQFVLRAEGEANGTALILVYADGNNSIAVFPGAGAGMSVAQVTAAKPLLSQARVVMSSCEVPLAATQAAFEIARTHGVLTLLNPAPAMPLPDTLWPLVDVLTPNEGELLLQTTSTRPPSVCCKKASGRWWSRWVSAVAPCFGLAKTLFIYPVMPCKWWTPSVPETPLPALWLLRWPGKPLGPMRCDGPMRLRPCPRRPTVP